MTATAPAAAIPLRPAATVMLLRDGTQGLEVFMLKRHDRSDVHGGVFVFPGGKVDAADAQLDAAAHLDSTPAQLFDSLGDASLSTQQALAFHVSALRELFEECGVLLTADTSDALSAQAAATLQGGLTFNEMLRQHGLRLSTANLQIHSRWITPVMTMTGKRFDTHFFAALLPEGVSPRHDNHEAVESVWLTPRKALQMYWQGEMLLAPPQIMSLANLARYVSAADVLADARRRTPPVILPEVSGGDADRIVAFPGDERHSISAAVIPGPTRLAFRGGRFEPVDGLDALLPA
ncbi:MAG: NUDIX hydrolase [Janthinobacterium lividum]